ncbi:MAG: UTP--glucose-1-phosphate uridylyltransferase [Myxococcales bacterium]|nr:UTP--glucose-1-phosphate uridylyltransferase [Myxococcales bacterium]
MTAIDPDTRALLDRFGFDQARLDAAAASLARGAPAAANAVAGEVTAPTDDDVIALPPPGSPARAELHARGAAAIRAGQVGVVYLAGGMATRFGGVVKAVVPVVGDRTFLDLKLADAARIAATHATTVPVWLLTSYATHARLEDDLAARAPAPATPIACVPQFVSLRLTPDGALFREADGALSPYAPGHGDLTFALRRAGALARFRAAGGRYLHMSNVDNLAATLDPAVIGAHLASGRAITAEVVRKDPGDRGGAPARVDGVVQILESFRFPPGFDQDAIAVFNTNTFVLDVEAIDRDFDLTYFHVAKQVDGATAIQSERLVGELTAFLPTQFLEVARGGVDGRFQPVKDPPELEARRAEIEAILRDRGVLG